MNKNESGIIQRIRDAMSEFISVKDKLPEIGQRCMIYNAVVREYIVAIYTGRIDDGGCDWQIIGNCTPFLRNNVTHWKLISDYKWRMGRMGNFHEMAHSFAEAISLAEEAAGGPIKISWNNDIVYSSASHQNAVDENPAKLLEQEKDNVDETKKD